MNGWQLLRLPSSVVYEHDREYLERLTVLITYGIHSYVCAVIEKVP